MNMQVGNHLYHLRLILLKVGTTVEEIREVRNEYFSNLCVWNGVYCVCVCPYLRERTSLKQIIRCPIYSQQLSQRTQNTRGELKR